MEEFANNPAVREKIFEILFSEILNFLLKPNIKTNKTTKSFLSSISIRYYKIYILIATIISRAHCIIHIFYKYKPVSLLLSLERLYRAFSWYSWTVRHPVSPVPEWTTLPMPEPVRYRNKGTQSGTGMIRYRNDPVPDWDTGCRNVGGIDLDADAQLLLFCTCDSLNDSVAQLGQPGEWQVDDQPILEPVCLLLLSDSSVHGSLLLLPLLGSHLESRSVC